MYLVIYSQIRSALNEALKKIHLDIKSIDDIQVEASRRRDLGDFTSNIALKLGADNFMPPMDLAVLICNNINKEGTYIKYAEAAYPGFINFILYSDWLSDTLKMIFNMPEEYAVLNREVDYTENPGKTFGIFKQYDYTQNPEALRSKENFIFHAQYTCARTKKILEANGLSVQNILHFHYELTGKASETQLIKKLAEAPHRIQSSAIKKSPDGIKAYIKELLLSFEKLHKEMLVERPDEKTQRAYLAVYAAVNIVTGNILKGLGINIPDKM